MGSPQRLTRPGWPPAGAAWARHGLFLAGTGSLLLLSVLASLVLWTVLPWALLRWSPTVVVSGSMHPAVQVGDVVLVRAVGPEEAREFGEGTVVVYTDPGLGRVLHRVVERRPEGSYLLQGDANPTPDSAAVSPAQIRGAAVLRIPWLGTPSVWLAQGNVPALAGAGVALLACLRLVSYAFDPAYDPWVATGRLLPVHVVLALVAPPADRVQPAALLPPGVGTLVHAGLVEQAAAARQRYRELAEVPR